jgi:hypothetical protein
LQAVRQTDPWPEASVHEVDSIEWV